MHSIPFLAHLYFSLTYLSNCSVFRDGSEKNLMQLVETVEKQLKVFIYPIPAHVRRCKKPFRPDLKVMFDMELRLPKYLSNSVVHTTDPDEADIFLVDHEWICLRVGSEPPHNDKDNALFTGEMILKTHVLPIWKSVTTKYPYFNRSLGHDHFTTFVFDNGPFCGAGHIKPNSKPGEIMMKLLENVSLIGNNGYSGQSRWDLHCDRPCKGTKYTFCHREGQDIVIPQPFSLASKHNNNNQNHFNNHNNRNETSNITSNNSNINNQLDVQRWIVSRTADTYFSGSIKKGLDCSPFVRNMLREFHEKNKEHNRYLWQNGDMLTAIFAICPAGWACWSVRLYHAIMTNTIPVILADPIIEPFERFLDWKQFTIKRMTGSNTNTFNHNELFPLFTDLHELAENSRRNFTSSIVMKKVFTLQQVSRWLTFNEISSISAYKLVLLEMWCRSRKGKKHPSCMRPVAYIANLSYI